MICKKWLKLNGFQELGSGFYGARVTETLYLGLTSKGCVYLYSGPDITGDEEIYLDADINTEAKLEKLIQSLRGE